MLMEERKENRFELNDDDDDSNIINVAEDQQMKCQCQYCDQYIFLDDLDSHEQQCENQQSQHQINKMI